MPAPEPITVHFDGRDTLWNYAGEPTMVAPAFLGEANLVERESGVEMRFVIEYRRSTTDKTYVTPFWHNERLPRSGAIGAGVGDKRFRDHCRTVVESAWGVLNAVHQDWLEAGEAWHAEQRDALLDRLEAATIVRREIG